MRQRIWVAEVGEANATKLITECRTSWLAQEYRPRNLGDGRIGLSDQALGASRELGEEEEGAITDDAEGLRIWIGDNGYELIPETE